jgi:NAD(P)H-flavin reductase
MSFASRSEAIGLELCEALLELNKAKGLHNFNLTVRFSDEKTSDGQKPPRWDNDYIKAQIELLSKVEDITKIYVCGPPIMNETFDKAFMGDKLTGRHLEHLLEIS